MKKKYTFSLIIAIAAVISAVILSSAAIISLSDNAKTESVSVRSGIEDGLIAVADYNSTDGLKISTHKKCWSQTAAESGLKFIFSEYGSADDYLRHSENGRVYISGTYDNSALVFYVKETENTEHKLSVRIQNIDESMFFAGIGSDSNAKVRLGCYSDSGFYRINLATSDSDSLIEIDYKNCFYDEKKGAYQIVLFVDDGMAAFDSIELTGLEISEIKGEKSDISYIDGVLMSPVEEEIFVNFISINNQMQKKAVMPTTAHINLLISFLEAVTRQMQEIIDAFILIYGQG